MSPPRHPHHRGAMDAPMLLLLGDFDHSFLDSASLQMSPLKSLILLVVLACAISQALAMVQHTQKEKDAITERLNHHIRMFDRQDVEGWKSDFSPSATIEGLGEKYTVANLRQYFKKLGATRLKSKITAPYSISDYHAVFARTIKASTTDGCKFSQDNVITLVRFNEKLEIVNWHDMWEEIESIKECAKDEL